MFISNSKRYRMKKWLLFSLLFLTSLCVHAEPLPASEVFKVSVKKIDPNTFAIQWNILPKYFLYSDRIQLNSDNDDIAQLGTLRFPTPLTKTDKQGRTFKVYRNQLNLPVGVLGITPGETIVNLRFQGCADDGFCYPPEVKQIKLAIDDKLALSQVDLETFHAPEATPLEKPQQDIADIFANHNWIMILLIFYGFGLLLSFTPCILPMVPVLSGIIVGHGKTATTKKAFFLSLSYVLSMSVTYAVVGAVVALLGANLQISMQSPWAISLFSLIFVLLALSMFGFYEFKLPDAWQSKIVGSSREQRGGHYLGAAIMGCLSTLILSPCVTAPLIGVLTYIAQTGNVLLGSVTLFTLSLGMGTPLLLIGTSAGKWLPETGSWMNAVKAFFGILLLAVAIYLMARILPAGLVMGLWACLLIFSGIYSGALTKSNTNQEKLCQGIGIILLTYGLLILIGASMGSSNPLQPLANLQAAPTVSNAFESAKAQSVKSVELAIKQAFGKPVMLDFYADWCASCKVMENTTFKDPRVQKALSHFIVIKVDVTANNKNDKALMQHFRVVAPPTFIFFNADGVQLNNLKRVGELNADEFMQTIKSIDEN
ncbi:Thiol:disulfide interchange protein DsbD precursor [Legionella pneumophila]|uniref:Thiol:disulfide interchange protein DsbD n=2 Tax=Legionella pneumophila TaxID=446 RepID=Q5ZXP5_LEGPH|nr:thiol:disulfide interchange protein DsbD [Legionella pneumophila subsp. pneumophila str. Philadelphia 1]PNL78944.1 protein-disulfide reductase DsbD [Legionella pneumophila subsp. pneumophila]QDD16859.1 protein-disulfide reductase DsbD [Legionella pneumophila]CZI32964.1 Thiol:disulfide interchange protein DsbD precursor [Legionella pneumophila]CZJ11734.1 Thiol:disulfide interchange protein DsbD precursor [Legionella pneumophila]